MPAKLTPQPKRKVKRKRPSSSRPASFVARNTREERRLCLFLQQTAEFRLALALYDDVIVRDTLIRSTEKQLAGAGVRVITLDLGEPSEARTLLSRIEVLLRNLEPSQRFAVMVVNLESRVDYAPEISLGPGPNTAFLETANLHRELFPETCRGPLVLWMTELLERAFTRYAPDLWHWRSHVFDLRRRGPSHHQTLDGAEAESTVIDSQMHPEDRLRRLEEELAAYRGIGDRFGEMRVLNEIGLARKNAGDAHHARQDFEQVLNIARETGNKGAEAAALANLGLALFRLGDTRKAGALHEQALAIHRAMGRRDAEERQLTNLGNVYLSLGEVRAAIEYYEQALELARENTDRRGESAALSSLGLAYASLGDTRKAIEFYEHALRIRRESGNRVDERNVLGNLGTAYAQLGDLQKALHFYEQQLELCREFGDRLGAANALGDLGVTYRRLGDVSKAVELLEQQLAISSEIADPRGKSTALGNLGNAYFELGDQLRAFNSYQEQVDIARKIGDRRSQAVGLYNMARVRAAAGEFDEAVRLGKASHLIQLEIEDPRAASVKAKIDQWQRKLASPRRRGRSRAKPK
jgi:tetratricopeptide (TPR) repeat protein